MFKIDSIYHGWFSILIGKEIITNSDYLGCDVPKYLLNAICNIIN